MITDATNFLPLHPPRLVASWAGVRLDGPGTRFASGQLVDEPIEARIASVVVLQLAARRR